MDGLVSVNVATPPDNVLLIGVPPFTVRETLPAGVPADEETVTRMDAFAG